MEEKFQDSSDARRELARRGDVPVLALPRGGVPVGREVARELEVPLDVLLVRTLAAPGQEELVAGR
jgi:putative phosphoribosyl transferase